MSDALRVDATGLPAAEWDAAAARLGGVMFQRHGWADYLAATEGGEPVRLAVRDAGGEVVALAAAARRASRRPILSGLTGELLLDAWPAAEPDQLPRAVASILDWARAGGFARVRLGSFASHWREGVVPADAPSTRRLEFQLDLDGAPDGLLAAFEYKRRKNIRKAERMGVEVRDLPGAEGIRALRAMQAESSRRIVERGGPDITFRDDPAHDPVRHLLAAGIGRIVGAFVEGECASASLFTVGGGLAYHTLSGHGARALEAQAPTFLLWTMMQRFRAEGIRYLNFGGCAFEASDPAHAEHGVYTYKAGFVSPPFECRTADVILRPLAVRATALLRRVGG